MALELIKTNRDHYNTILLTERYDDNILIDLIREACKEKTDNEIGAKFS